MSRFDQFPPPTSKDQKPNEEMGELSPEAKFAQISKEFEQVFETKDARELSHIFDRSEGLWRSMESRDGAEAVQADLDWFDQNNHRINLYQIAGQRSEGWRDEDMTPERGNHLFALKLRDAIIKQFAQTENQLEASRALARTLRSEGMPEHTRETVIDTLARLGADGGRELEAYLSDERVAINRRLRAALSMSRYGERSPMFVKRAQEVLYAASKSSSPSELNTALELCGLLGGEASRNALEAIDESAHSLAPNQRQWLERDLISIRLALDPDSISSVEIQLEGRVWKSVSGIVFGSIQPTEGFQAYVERNHKKLELLGEALKRTNDAFGSEPILYVDLVPDNTTEIANEGWTQNAIYLSQTLTGHPRVSIRTTIQGAIHEACERWESKGFVDARMEQDYLRLLGTEYDNSGLDKFRLRHRYDIPSRAGHPWDGTREYMAEAGSILLADPSEREKLFDSEKDVIALQSLSYVQGLIQKHSA